MATMLPDTSVILDHLNNRRGRIQLLAPAYCARTPAIARQAGLLRRDWQ